jgi:dienelactone hydrolase
MIVRSEFRDLDTPTGPMRTHAYTPVRPTGPQRFPGLLLYPEIYQQTGPIARLSAQFASHGFVLMAPEIYHEHEPLGTVLGYDQAGTEKGNVYKQRNKLSTFDNDAAVVIRALEDHPAAMAGWARSASASAATWHSARRCTPRSWPPPASIRPTRTAAPWGKARTPTRWPARARSAVSWR